MHLRLHFPHDHNAVHSLSASFSVLSECVSILLQSPSIELFLSILEFHSNLASCAEFIIHQVEQTSLSIISDCSGHIHRELDHSFITALMKQLLLKAKLKFAQCMDSVGVELCDT